MPPRPTAPGILSHGEDLEGERFPLGPEGRRGGRHENGKPVLRRMDSGTMKRDVAFACVRREVHKSDPLGSSGVIAQLAKHEELGGNRPPAIVTPQLGINRE